MGWIDETDKFSLLFHHRYSKMFSPSENKDFRQLDRFLTNIFDPSSSEDIIMNVRARLGKTLHYCCVSDPHRALDMIIKKMESIKTTPGISIILLACASFVLKYIPFDQNSDFANWITAPLLRHAVSSDGNHIFNLVQFFRAGGTKLLPFPDVFLGELLLHSENIGSNAAKPIGYLISVRPVSHSSIFWRFFNISEKNEAFFTLLSRVVIYGELLPPTDKEQLNCLIQSCEDLSKPENQFHEIEKSLTILRWLIANRCYCPEKLTVSYKISGLNALVVDCWAEYASFGDLSKIPKFEMEETIIQNLYIKLIRNASKNPDFTLKSLKISHWLWDEIHNEFSNPNHQHNHLEKHCINENEQNNENMKNELDENDQQKNTDVKIYNGIFDKITQETYSTSENTKKKYSLYDLGTNELVYCADIAYILPEWFFIHCLRLRCKNSEVSAKILKIISETPSCIILDNMPDFIDFVIHHLTFPQNADIIANCIRQLICILLPRMNPLIVRIIESIDFFDETNLVSRLTVLNTIFSFGVETESFLDLFDSIWECIPLVNMSLSLCQSIFKFFTLIAPFVPDNSNNLFDLALAAICSFCLPNNEPSFINKNHQAHIIFSACLRFYSVVSSDIVTNPNYTPQSSYPITPLGLVLLNKLPLNKIPLKEGMSLLFDSLPILLPLFPVETLIVANYLIDLKFEFKKQLALLCSQLKRELSYNSSINLNMLVIPFRTRIIKILPSEVFSIKSTNVYSLCENIDETRLTLQANPELLPLMITKARQLSLLLELWAPRVDASFLSVLSNSVEENRNWNDSRQIRSFLAHFNYKQPECCLYDSWIHREFCNDEQYKPRKISKYQLINQLTPENTDNFPSNFEDAFDLLIKNYPVDCKLANEELLGSIVKNYRYKSNLTNLICFIISEKVNDCVRLFKNNFWFLKFLLTNDVPFNFPTDSINEKCICLGIRNKFIEITTSNQNDITTSFQNIDKENNNDKETENQERDDSVNNSIINFNINGTDFNDDVDEIDEHEWEKIDKLYSLSSSQIENISQTLYDIGNLLYVRFLPSRISIPTEILIQLLKIPNSSTNQHILDYLVAFTSNVPPNIVEQLLLNNENLLFNFINRVDLHNPLVFETLNLFVNTICMMRQFGAFSTRIAEIFLKNVFSYEVGIASACVFEVLPMLKKIFSSCNGIKFKNNEQAVQFLNCLKQGFPTIRDYIPELNIE
ncbi:hypothetical protein TRFO_39164 [Tritrichomonas foetus]|uniref:Uncharacterized protein n=1 Tax=Tritrichomonas foetus TaxID=1144522 RepID=A0A1J4J611_9EUKA|nr:hypothetical protein TRFO_39164 [Tritrichomonas foetus]|eukprot:OHS94670.1 hypothetical protein TRFO_39164 [Tritrichomonas foetus]